MNHKILTVLMVILLLLAYFPQHVIYAEEQNENSIILAETVENIVDDSHINIETGNSEENLIEKEVKLPDNEVADLEFSEKEKLEDTENIKNIDEIKELEITDNIKDTDEIKDILSSEILIEKKVNKVLFYGDKETYFLHISEKTEILPLETIGYTFYNRDFVSECKIVWRSNEFEKPGRYILIGDIILPEGCTFEGEPLTLKSVVIVYDDTGAPFIKVNNFSYTSSAAPLLLSQGATESEVLQAFEEATRYTNGIAPCWTEDGDTFEAPFTLDLSTIDTKNPGVYYVTADLPKGMIWGEQGIWGSSVYVVPKDKVVLNAINKGNTDYLLQWVYKETNPELWVSVNGGSWEKQGPYNNYGRFFDPDQIIANGLAIRFNSLKSGHIYRFQVQYDDSKFSDVLVLDFINTDVPKATNEHGGDRSGIDRSENTSPPYEEQIPNDRQSSTNGYYVRPTASPPVSSPIPLHSPSPTHKAIQVIPQTYNTQTNTIKPNLINDDKKPNIPQLDFLNVLKPDLIPLIPVVENQRTYDNIDVIPLLSLTTVTSEMIPAHIPNESEATVPAKPIDEKNLNISSQELSMMITANPNYVNFKHNNMWLSIPTAYLQELPVSENDMFSINLEKLDENSFSVMFLLNQEQLGNPFIDPFLVSIEWNNSAVSCVSETGVISNATVSDQKAIFPLMHMGNYQLKLAEQTISAIDTPQKELPTATDIELEANNVKKDDSTYNDDFLPVAIATGFGILGVTLYLGFLWRKKMFAHSMDDIPKSREVR